MELACLFRCQGTITFGYRLPSGMALCQESNPHQALLKMHPCIQKDTYGAEKRTLEIDPHKYSHLIFARGVKASQRIKDSLIFSTNGAGAIESSYVKKVNQDTDLTFLNLSCDFFFYLKFYLFIYSFGKFKRT